VIFILPGSKIIERYAFQLNRAIVSYAGMAHFIVKMISTSTEKGEEHEGEIMETDVEREFIDFVETGRGQGSEIRPSRRGSRSLKNGNYNIMSPLSLRGLTSALSGPGFVSRRNFQVLFPCHDRSANLFQKGWLYFLMQGKHFPRPSNLIKARVEKLWGHL
jgi:hypothetical protein